MLLGLERLGLRATSDCECLKPVGSEHIDNGFRDPLGAGCLLQQVFELTHDTALNFRKRFEVNCSVGRCPILAEQPASSVNWLTPPHHNSIKWRPLTVFRGMFSRAQARFIAFEQDALCGAFEIVVLAL